MMKFSLLLLSTITTHYCEECVLQPLPLVCVCVCVCVCVYTQYCNSAIHVYTLILCLLLSCNKNILLCCTTLIERCISINMNVQCVRINKYKLLVWWLVGGESENSSSSAPLLCIKSSSTAHGETRVLHQ